MDIKFTPGTNLRTDSTLSGKGRVAPAPGDSGMRPAADEGADAVTLTSAAKTLSAAQGESQAKPMDEARVAAIRAAIAEGRYQIDNQRLARRILEFEGAFA